MTKPLSTVSWPVGACLAVSEQLGSPAVSMRMESREAGAMRANQVTRGSLCGTFLERPGKLCCCCFLWFFKNKTK